MVTTGAHDPDFVCPLGSEVVWIHGPEPNSWTADESAGYFVGRLVLMPFGERRMIVLEDFAFVDSRGLRWEVKAGAVVDGSSIPWLLQRWLGSPWVGLHRFGSSIHDDACVRKSMPYQLVHSMYHDACRAAGAANADTLYFGVKHWGPRKGFPTHARTEG